MTPGSTPISGIRTFRSAAATGLPENLSRWMETAPGEALRLNVAANVVVGGTLSYRIVEPDD